MTVLVNGRPLSDEDCIIIYTALQYLASNYYDNGHAILDKTMKNHEFSQAIYCETLAKDFEQEAIIAVHD